MYCTRKIVVAKIKLLQPRQVLECDRYRPCELVCIEKKNGKTFQLAEFGRYPSSQVFEIAEVKNLKKR